MNILLVMVPLSIVLLIGAGFAFFWAVEHDQFDDMDTPALLPLVDVPFAESAAQEEADASLHPAGMPAPAHDPADSSDDASR